MTTTPTPDYTTIQLHRPTPHIAQVYLNRPNVRNAFNETTITELGHVFVHLGEDPDLRVVVLGGHGAAFCAGADLAWMRSMADYSWDENHADAKALADMLWVMHVCPVPIVGRVHGDCYAGGVGLAAVCDVLIAAEGVAFCLSEARLGLLPATISPYVIRAMGERQAQRYIVTAEVFDAARAAAMGFVHEVVPADQLDAKVTAVVNAIVANGPLAVRACKRLVQDIAGESISPAVRDDTAKRIADIRASVEGKEGVQSFLNKRKPGWLAS